MSSVFEKYYLPYRLKDESKESLIRRLDNDYILSNFKYLADRDDPSDEDLMSYIKEKK